MVIRVSVVGMASEVSSSDPATSGRYRAPYDFTGEEVPLRNIKMLASHYS